MAALSLVQLMGTSVSDSPGFLHSAHKAHEGRGSAATSPAFTRRSRRQGRPKRAWPRALASQGARAR
eukprot:scaffold120109_cov33-Phaeocystis_antarctica.AAC.1